MSYFIDSSFLYKSYWFMLFNDDYEEKTDTPSISGRVQHRSCTIRSRKPPSPYHITNQQNTDYKKKLKIAHSWYIWLSILQGHLRQFVVGAAVGSTVVEHRLVSGRIRLRTYPIRSTCLRLRRRQTVRQPRRQLQQECHDQDRKSCWNSVLRWLDRMIYIWKSQL